MNNEQKNKSLRRNDILLIVALLLIATVGVVYLFLFRSVGNEVRVTVNGEVYAVYPLSDSLTADIVTGDDGKQVNRLVVSEGKAYIESATCPDGICVAHRPIFRDSESIVCLPNRVVVTVITNGDREAPDIVV